MPCAAASGKLPLTFFQNRPPFMVRASAAGSSPDRRLGDGSRRRPRRARVFRIGIDGFYGTGRQAFPGRLQSRLCRARSTTAPRPIPRKGHLRRGHGRYFRLRACAANCFRALSRCASFPGLRARRFSRRGPIPAPGSSRWTSPAAAPRRPTVADRENAPRRRVRESSIKARPGEAGIDRPPPPASLDTVTSSGLSGETAKYGKAAPRMEAFLYAVRLVQVSPPWSDRNALLAKAV